MSVYFDHSYQINELRNSDNLIISYCLLFKYLLSMLIRNRLTIAYKNYVYKFETNISIQFIHYHEHVTIIDRLSSIFYQYWIIIIRCKTYWHSCHYY